MSSRKDKDNNSLLVYLTTWDKELIDIMGINLVKDNHLSGDVKYINENSPGR